ncbi:hypothetical protein BCEP27_100162 [Burkholderia cepacia]
MCLDQFAVPREVFCCAALLVDRREVVIARDIWLIFGRLVVEIRAGRETEARSAVDHIDAERQAVLHEVGQFARNVGVGALELLVAPMCKEAGIDLPTHDRRAGELVPDLCDVVRLGSTQADYTTIERRAVFLQLLDAVVGEERAGDTTVDPYTANLVEVCDVVAIARVLVFDLEHQDRATARRHERTDTRCERGDIRACRRHEARVAVRSHAQLNVVMREQARRDSAKIPFTADVRTRAQQHPHAFVLAEPNERFDVALVRIEVESAVCRLVKIPHDVHGDGVHAHRLRHLDPVPPVFTRDPCGMHFTAANLEWSTVEQKCDSVVAKGKRVTLSIVRLWSGENLSWFEFRGRLVATACPEQRHQRCRHYEIPSVQNLWSASFSCVEPALARLSNRPHYLTNSLCRCDRRYRWAT